MSPHLDAIDEHRCQ